MATEVALSSYTRGQFLMSALARANQKLKTRHLAVGLISRISTIKDEAVNLEDLDQRTDFALALHYQNRVLMIDVVYLGPKKPTSVEELSQDIFNKAIDHVEAMSDSTVLITPLGTKYNTSHLKKHVFEIDSQGYLRVNGLRIISRDQQMYRPVKATQFRSHTRITPQELESDVLNITERLDRGLTTRKKGEFCVTKKAQFVALEKIVPRRQADAEKYNEGQYIPLVLTWTAVEQLLAGTSNFFSE